MQQQKTLENCLLKFSYFNLFLVASVGLLLRSFPFLSSFPLEYKNILHGHSHFAFGGWIMPVLLWAVMKSYPEITALVDYKHWRNIAVLMLFSAYGMLASFPEQGYKAVSITFSTLSIASGYYWAIVTWKAMKQLKQTPGSRFLKWALIFMVISSVGPFATGPLIVMGKQGKPIYFDAIYFYLHFQYNGVFTLIVIGLLYKQLEKHLFIKNGYRVADLLVWAGIPTYFLSVLWHKPGHMFNIIGGVGAVLQLIAMWYLLKDILKLKWNWSWPSILLTISIASFCIKVLLQFLSAIPYVAHLAYEYRNFVIGYLHLVLLGFISLFIFAYTMIDFQVNRIFNAGLVVFLSAFITTELILVISAFASALNLELPYYTVSLFSFSCLFPLAILLMIISLRKVHKRSTASVNYTVKEQIA